MGRERSGLLGRSVGVRMPSLRARSSGTDRCSLRRINLAVPVLPAGRTFFVPDPASKLTRAKDVIRAADPGGEDDGPIRLSPTPADGVFALTMEVHRILRLGPTVPFVAWMLTAPFLSLDCS
jgi:hypothetical protein